MAAVAARSQRRAYSDSYFDTMASAEKLFSARRGRPPRDLREASDCGDSVIDSADQKPVHSVLDDLRKCPAGRR